ncbi:RidA family protein [Fibrisoma montanum]|uniref:RidA family protein n=1 Tax=Fibrisoma montanum TaxID=2305895 RepID=A0A418M1N4_9BACT|nr:RidA family protein [Fibrisoma montanum]RIV19500.1 RidA family protein [Fibrisoma montanum]
MKKLVTTVVVLMLAGVVYAQSGQSTIEKQKFNLSKEGEDNAGYAQAVKAGNTIYISGTVAGGDMATALTKVYDRLQQTLAAYGATFQNVVKENLYTTDIDEVKKHTDVRKKYYKGDWPAATWVQIQRLYSPNASLEIELVAVLPDK